MTFGSTLSPVPQFCQPPGRNLDRKTLQGLQIDLQMNTWNSILAPYIVFKILFIYKYLKYVMSHMHDCKILPIIVPWWEYQTTTSPAWHFDVPRMPPEWRFHGNFHACAHGPFQRPLLEKRTVASPPSSVPWERWLNCKTANSWSRVTLGLIQVSPCTVFSTKPKPWKQNMFQKYTWCHQDVLCGTKNDGRYCQHVSTNHHAISLRGLWSMTTLGSTTRWNWWVLGRTSSPLGIKLWQGHWQWFGDDH